MSTDDDLIEGIREALPPVVFAFLQNVNKLQAPTDMGDPFHNIEITPAMVAKCWLDALDECDTIGIIEHQASSGRLYRDDWLEVLRHAGLLK